MAENRQYDHEYKVQAVKLAKETRPIPAFLFKNSFAFPIIAATSCTPNVHNMRIPENLLM